MLLSFLHAVNIFIQCNQLLFLTGIEHQQILQGFLVCAKVIVYTEFDLQTEILPELLILFAVIAQHQQQLGFDFLFDTVRNHLQLTVMLQHFTGDIQRKILRIHQTLYETEMLRNQLFRIIHNEDTTAIQLQTLLVVLRIIVERCLTRDKHQCCKGNCTLYTRMNHLLRLCIIVEFALIELIVFFFCYFRLASLPQRNHGIQRFQFLYSFIFRFSRLIRILVFTFRIVHTLAGFHPHLNRVTDIVGIFLNQTLNLILLQIVVIILIFRVILQIQNDFCSMLIFFTFINGIAVNRIAAPQIGGFLTVFLRRYLHTAGNHKCRIEADTKLSDDIHIILLLCIFHLLLKRQRATLRNRSQIVLKLILVHTQTVITDCQSTVFLICLQINFKAGCIYITQVIRQCLIIQLVNCITCIGDQLSQKDFLMCINRVDHQI